MASKIPFPKQYSEPKDLLSLLQSRGLTIDDPSKAESYLQNIGYYRLSAYMYPFLEKPKTNHIYKNGINFTDILRLYKFDKKLRVVIFNEIEKIEIAVRCTLVNIGCMFFKSPFWMTNPNNYADINKYAHTLKLILDALNRSREDFIVHFNETYSDPYPPSWMLSEILPFGIITRIFSNLKDKKVKKLIAQYFGLQPGPFESWLTIVTLTRNACCHHARIWNKQNTIRAMMPKSTGFPWINNEINLLRIYFNLCIIKYFLNIISPGNDFTEKIDDLLNSFPEIDTKAMGFPEKWKDEPVWSDS